MFSEDTVGFRNSKSCLDSLSRLVTRIQIGFTKDKFTLACFLDIENAYNNVDIGSLLSILDALGVRSKICSYVWNFLSNQKLKIKSEESDVVMEML